jgi:MFS family permease
MTITGSRTSSASRHRFGFWAVTYVFLVVLAFSAAPSPLYVLYARRDHFSSLMITVIYAACALGIVASLFFVSHLSGLHGRRIHLLTAVGLAVVSAALFIAWPSLAELFVARVLCGVAVGLTVSTATAYLNELYQAYRPEASGLRPQLAATSANLGASASGPPSPASSPSTNPSPSCAHTAAPDTRRTASTAACGGRQSRWRPPRPPGLATHATLHGSVHGLAGLVVFSSVAAACFVLARRFAGDPAWRGWAPFSVVTDLLVAVFFVASLATAPLPGAPSGRLQRVAIVAGWGWVMLLAARLLGNVGSRDGRAPRGTP